MWERRSFFILLNLVCHWPSSITASLANAKCYYPNGAIVDNYQPCDQTGSSTHSVCCELSSSVCSTKGLCYGSNGYLYRGGCTDASWESNACPQVCENVSRNTFSPLVPCTGDGIVSNRFCCYVPGATAGCCDQSFELWTNGEHHGAGVPYDPVARAAAAQRSSSSRESSESGSTSSGPRTSTVLAATASSSPTDISLMASASSASSRSLKKNTVIGVGVGVPLGALLLLGLGFLLFKERKRRVDAERTVAQITETADMTQPRTRYMGPIQEVENREKGPEELRSRPIHELQDQT